MALTWTSIKQLFSKRPKQQFISVGEAEIGQLVEVEFRDPRTLGIQVPGQLTCTRFNPDEYEDRKFKGFIVFVGKWEGGPEYGKYIVVSTNRLNRQRQFLFLAAEIESIRLID